MLIYDCLPLDTTITHVPRRFPLQRGKDWTLASLCDCSSSLREIWIFKYCWKRRREQPEHLPLTQLLPNSSSLPHQSFGFLTMQVLCTLLLLSMPLPFPVKAEGTRGTRVKSDTAYKTRRKHTVILQLTERAMVQERCELSNFHLFRGKCH